MQASIQMSAQANAAKVAAAGAALLVATPAFAGDAGAGEKIFNANCAACHAGGQNSVVPDHTLEKAAIEKVCMLCLAGPITLRLQRAQYVVS